MDGTELEPTLLQLLAENVPHRIYAKDGSGRFTFANRAVALGMGVAQPSDLVGKTDRDFYPAEAAARYAAEEQQVLLHGQSILNQEEQVDYLLLGEQAWLMTTKIPLRDRSGAVVGLVGINYDVTRRKRAEQALQVANLNAETAAHALANTVRQLRTEVDERQRIEIELRRRALHDDLTGLPNRSLFMDRLEVSISHAHRVGESVTLLFLDLDRFKNVNDTLGHAAGDELLIGVSRRVGKCLRQSDTLARLGGDEFVVLLPNTITEEELAAFIDRVEREVARPVLLGGRNITVSCSVGRATFPLDGDDPAALLKLADAEMYRAKQKRRGVSGTVPDGPAHSALEPREVAAQLRHALRRDELRLQFQPQVDLKSGEVVGVEALVRWHHPQWGLVPPSHFIPIAEQCGEIGPIGEWVLRTACAQAARWQHAGYEPVRMGVNLSAQQFLDPGLDALVSQVLVDTGLAPRWLELELTESASMRDPLESIRILGRFHAMGIALAIDDFGTGYSNFASLLDFQVDRVKLDRSLIGRLEERNKCGAMVKSVVSMMHRLDFQVVAEGVETQAQQRLLQSFGCDVMQGYLFSRPLDAAACAALLPQARRTPIRPRGRRLTMSQVT